MSANQVCKSTISVIVGFPVSPKDHVLKACSSAYAAIRRLWHLGVGAALLKEVKSGVCL